MPKLGRIEVGILCPAFHSLLSQAIHFLVCGLEPVAFFPSVTGTHQPDFFRGETTNQISTFTIVYPLAVVCCTSQRLDLPRLVAAAQPTEILSWNACLNSCSRCPGCPGCPVARPRCEADIVEQTSWSSIKNCRMKGHGCDSVAC